jgi:hypothetical protein
MIRIVIGVMFAIIICEGSVSVANESSSGCYINIATVKSWIEPPAGFSMRRWKPEEASVVEKSIMRSGDSVGFGIARAYPRRRDLLDPDRLDRILTLIRLSFSWPRMIISEEDKSPTVTMLLLFALKQECEDIKLRQKIIDAEIYISEQLVKSEKKMEKSD